MNNPARKTFAGRPLRVAGLILALSVGGCAAAHLGDSAATHSPSVARAPIISPRDAERARGENELAIKLIGDGKFDEAREDLRKALIADRQFGPAHNNLGRVYYQQSQFYQAALEFDEASKLMPRQPEPLNNLGLVYEATGKLTQAIDAYHRALALAPDNPQYLGNCVRSRVRNGDESEEIQEMLRKLIAQDIRPDWRNWARRALNRIQSPDSGDASNAK